MQKLLTVLFLLFGFGAFAQTGSLKGFVYDKTNGEPLSGATVAITSLKKGAQSNLEGFYNIPKLPPGTYDVTVTALGYESMTKQAIVVADEVTSLKFELAKKSRELKGVSVSAKKDDKLYETKVGMTRITPKELKLLPSVGGEPDIAQYLQVMPGVVSTGDQGGQLYIRGGSPIQNKILLDGMTIYNPFHSIGIYSVFETDALRSADVMSGGFGVE